jgi:hypothetical protein
VNATASNTPEPLEARLSLFGFVATPVTLSVTPRTRAERVTRSILSMVAAIIFAPIVFLIPPHAEWVLITIAAGIYWARKNWIAEYVVASFEGVCPRCYTAIKVKSGTTLRFPHAVVCYQCHQHPVLEAGGAPPIDDTRREDSTQPVPGATERRPVRIWSPAGSNW